MAWLDKVEHHARQIGTIAGAATTAYNVGKGLYYAGSAILPYAAMLL